eukprot:PhF_6_TR19003/c0_g1_i3/m.27850
MEDKYLLFAITGLAYPVTFMFTEVIQRRHMASKHHVVLKSSNTYLIADRITQSLFSCEMGGFRGFRHVITYFHEFYLLFLCCVAFLYTTLPAQLRTVPRRQNTTRYTKTLLPCLFFAFICVFGINFVCNRAKRMRSVVGASYEENNAVCLPGSWMHSFAIVGPLVPGMLVMASPMTSGMMMTATSTSHSHSLIPRTALTNTFRFLAIILQHLVQETIFVTVFRRSQPFDDTHTISVAIYVLGEALWGLVES